jgi:hypothetical protein
VCICVLVDLDLCGFLVKSHHHAACIWFHVISMMLVCSFHLLIYCFVVHCSSATMKCCSGVYTSYTILHSHKLSYGDYRSVLHMHVYHIFVSIL